MPVQQQSRTILNQLFSDGERPTGDNFAGAWSTFLSQKEDGLLYDGKNLVISSKVGITLGNPDGGPEGTAGTLRFNGTHVQYYDPGIHAFKDIAGDAGAFLPVGGGPSVAFKDGNVGIGTFASSPTHLLEIPLEDNSGPGQRVLLGNLVIHNGPAATSGAYIGNNSLATNNAGYALFQDNNGKTTINASNSAGSQLSLAINGEDKFVIASNGSMGIDGDVNIGSEFGGGHTLTITNITAPNSPSSTPSALTLFGDDVDDTTKTHIATLSVHGSAEKSRGGLTWAAIASDARVKKDIRAYKDGLNKLIQLDPVIYKYNGKGGINDNGGDYVGLIAQDIQKVAPEMIFSKSMRLNPEDEKETELLNYDFHNVLFMFINAFKELNTKVEKLEKTNKNEKRKTGNSPGTDH